MKLMKLFATGLLALAPAMAQYSTPMRDVENPGRTPVKFTIGVVNSATLAGPGGSVGLVDNTTVVVPAGKRLVIDTVSFTCQVATGSTVVYAAVSPVVGLDHSAHYLPLQKLGSVQASFSTVADVWMGVYQTTLVADPGTTVNIGLTVGNYGGNSASTVNAVGFSAEISGHYITLP